MEAAIKRAMGKDTSNYEEILYEGYAPHGVALLVETATDNHVRTVANVKSHFNKGGGAMGNSGSVSFQFKKMGVFKLNPEGLVMVTAPFVFAAKEVAQAAPAGVVDYTKAIIIGCSILAAGFAIAFGTIGTGNGMGAGLNGATNAVGRNPEAQGKILLTMMVGLAMIESLAIYALVVALILLYANPLLKLIG